MTNALQQDDLYVDMSFARVLDQHGVDASSDDFGEMLKNTRYNLAHANLAARRVLRRGIPASLSGTPRYNVHANDIAFQMEVDFIGLMAPGCSAWQTISVIGRAGWSIRVTVCAVGCSLPACTPRLSLRMIPGKLSRRGLAAIEPRGSYGRLIADVLAWSKQHPRDWETVWRLLEEKWNKDEPCPEGAASAGGILGVVPGYNGISAVWRCGIPAIGNQKFRFTDFDFRSIVASRVQRAITLARETGGRLEGNKLFLKRQTPQPFAVENWNPGVVAERIAATGARWRFEGPWTEFGTPVLNGSSWDGKQTDARGAVAEVSFEGSGAILAGPYSIRGGTADIYVDGKLQHTVDAYETLNWACESLWHDFKLKRGKHSLRVVVRGEPSEGSQGSDFGVVGLVVFR